MITVPMCARHCTTSSRVIWLTIHLERPLYPNLVHFLRTPSVLCPLLGALLRYLREMNLLESLCSFSAYSTIECIVMGRVLGLVAEGEVLNVYRSQLRVTGRTHAPPTCAKIQGKQGPITAAVGCHMMSQRLGPSMTIKMNSEK